MGTVRQLLLAAVLVSATQLGTLTPPVADDDDAADQASRWQALQQALFPGRALKDGSGIVQLDAPPRALDAALVPISIGLSAAKPIKGVYLVIDGNPSATRRTFHLRPQGGRAFAQASRAGGSIHQHARRG